jgi:hypothetical protein
MAAASPLELPLSLPLHLVRLEADSAGASVEARVETAGFPLNYAARVRSRRSNDRSKRSCSKSTRARKAAGRACFDRVGVPHGKLLAEFSRVESNLTQAADHYFDHQELFLANYNKAKHGAPIIRTSDLAQQEFYVLAPDLSGSKRYQFTKFNSGPHAVRKYVGLTKQVSETSRALVSFACNLKTVGPY